ncbi:HD domain-containing phosphohydrolase [Geodermatophilus ruber]|uniref:HD domain-containing phosphohydrolase n=1 Tax=Geodermatophilus ruber TaxID=504800 RepID=UPI0015A52C5F|nr:HD domain-containing phosphohydrolase [Geodermatophilus ruber]
MDDEAAILGGLRRQLRPWFTVHTATSGAEALQLLESQPVTVVVSDMRMPEMDGATFLSHVRQHDPDIVRILLTGNADAETAITAVNEGQIYRFLTKPCPPEVLVAELGSAVEVHRLVRAEKELLRTTLRKTVASLTATLSLAQPALLARAVRINRIVSELVEALEVEEPWEIEVTSMLTHLGAVTLPPTVLAKLDAGRPLDEDEREMDSRVIGLSRDLVGDIPRLERVAEAIGWQRARYDGKGNGPGVPGGEDLPLGARILRAAVDFDAGMSVRRSVQDTIAVLQADAGAYDPQVLEALIRCHAVEEVTSPPRPVDVYDLQEGMEVFDDIVTMSGVLLVGRGTVVTEALIHRLENYAGRGEVTGVIRVKG